MSSRQQRNRKQVQRLGDTDWSSETVRGPHATLDPACHRNKPQHKRPGRPKDKLKAEPPKSSALPPTTLTPKERAAKRSRVVDCLDPYTNLKTAEAPQRERFRSLGRFQREGCEQSACIGVGYRDFGDGDGDGQGDAAYIYAPGAPSGLHLDDMFYAGTLTPDCEEECVKKAKVGVWTTCKHSWEADEHFLVAIPVKQRRCKQFTDWLALHCKVTDERYKSVTYYLL